jgi:uncharacterized protein YciI
MRLSKEEIYAIVETGKPYWFVELQEGPERAEEDPEETGLQLEHLDHLFALKEQGKLLLAGPTPKASALRGICIFNGIMSLEEVEEVLNDDPMIEGGHLTFNIHDFFGIPGDSLT